MNKCFKYVTNDQWQTPSNIYTYFIDYYGYIDFNPLCVDYENSLLKEFNCNLFCNPPYSNIEPFVDYMLNHIKKGFRVVMLLPVRSGTKWFYKLFNSNKCHFCFFTQRLKFSNKGCCPFDCMLCVLDNLYKNEFCFIDRELNFV